MISLLLVIIAAIANAVGDKIQFHWSTSIFRNRDWDSWANPVFSWRRKWREGKPGREAFPGSSTLLVWTTDLWHLMKFVQLNFIFLAIVLHQPLFEISSSIWNSIVDFACLRIAYGLTFEVFFSKILTEK